MNTALWKEIGKALLANVVVPVATEVVTKAATKWAENANKTNKVVIRFNVKGEDV